MGRRRIGFRGRVWTCARVDKVIEEVFRITYHTRYVVRLLKRLHWTLQAPIRRALLRARGNRAVARRGLAGVAGPGTTRTPGAGFRGRIEVLPLPGVVKT